MNKLEKWILENMINRLESVEGLGGYVCDLAYLLYEEDNYSGVIANYSRYNDAKEWIITFWDELDEEVEEYKSNFGEYPNPFENECAFMVRIVLNAAYRLIPESKWIWDNWDENVTYTKEIIEQIEKELEEKIRD
jgi:hypothetical protein|nr:MAG TPA: hypothetical protein [Caudoviricetes sp.]